MLLSAALPTDRLTYAQAPPAKRSLCQNPATGLTGHFGVQQSMAFAEQYLNLGRTSEAIPCLENAYSADREDPKIAYELSVAYLATRNSGAAREVVEDQLKIQESATFHSLLGTIDAQQGQFREATAQFQQATREDPSERNTFDFGTSLLRFQGNSAEQIFRYGISRFPDSVRMHMGLGYSLWIQGHTIEAVQEMCAAEQMDPDDPRPMEMLGDIEQIPSSVAERVTAQLAGLVKQHPDNGQLLFYYAMALSGVWSGQDSSHLNAVLPMIEHALALNPKLVKAYFYLAENEEQKGEKQKALQNYQRAAELNPNDERIAYRLAFAYKQAGDDAMFRKQLQKFRALHEKAADNASAAAVEELNAGNSAKEP